MHYFIYPKKDTTLYSQYPTMNTGTDQILELVKTVDVFSTSSNTRILVQFDLTTLSSSILAGKISTSSVYYLNLFSAKAYNLPLDYTIEAYAVSQSWNMGTGKYYDDPHTTDGATWTYRAEGIPWVISGSDFITSSGVSQSFSFEDPDPKINVTTIVRSWLSSSYPNNGFLLKRPSSEEAGTTEYGRLNFYSTDTNTVYLPSLEVVWDDSIFITGSTILILSGSYTGTLSGSSTISYGGTVQSTYTGSITSAYTGSYSQSVQIVSASLTSSYFNGSANAVLYSSGSSSIAQYDGYISGTFNNIFISSSNFTGSIINLLTGSITGNLSSSVNASCSLSGSLNGSLVGTIRTASFNGWTQLYTSGIITGSINYLTPLSYTVINTLTGSLNGIVSGSITGSSVGTLIGTQSGSIVGVFTPVLSGSSFEPLLSDQLSIMMKNLKPSYKYQTKVRIRFTGKDLNQRKTFSNVPLSNFSIIKYLPHGTQYSIVDAYSGRVIVPFDSYTNISCDLEGNYFDLDLNGFMPERFYKIQFKVPMNGTDIFLDKNYIFKVVK